MIVQGIEIVDFRNIGKAALEFSPSLNLVSGRNAQGKTNLLEAIHFFSLGRSFRTRSAAETVRFGRPHALVRFRGRTDAGVQVRIDLGIEAGGGLRVSIGGKRCAGISEILGLVPSVLFVPEDVELPSGPPAARRSFLDFSAAQVSPVFLAALRDYRRILRQRNNLLRDGCAGGGDGREMAAWDEALAGRAEEIVAGRREMLARVGERAAGHFAWIVPNEAPLETRYRCSFGGGTAGELREELERCREQERRRGCTLAGPHHDDVSITLGGRSLRRYGSQGRKRTVAVALKLAQAEIIHERRGERPVVMLDDIFSELDPPTAGRMRDKTAGRYQSFITSPRPGDLDADGEAALFTVEDGVFAREGRPEG